MWHVSKYLIFAEDKIDKNKINCINLFTGSFIKINLKDFLLLFNYKKLNENQEILKKFIEEKIIINFDEYDFWLKRAKINSDSTDKLSLSICPTLDCNFNCPYCFEKHRQGKMSLEVQEDIINFINKVNSKNKLKKLNITWFGGEPLLNIEIIESLSQKIISFSEKNNIQYFSNIITNGYLLNQKNADILAKAKVNKYQITLDGVSEIHDKTRCLKNGSPSFNKIVDNLKNTKIVGHINIRQNIYNDNKNNIEELKNFLEQLKKTSNNNISYYFGEVCLNDNLEENNKLSMIESLNFSKIKLSQSDIFIPKIKFLACGAQRKNTFTIDELGNLYKCRDQAGTLKYSFGNIKNWNDNIISYPNNFNTFIDTIEMINDKDCIECAWFPVCAGGCPKYRLFYKKKCIPYKGYEEEFINKIAEKYNNFLTYK